MAFHALSWFFVACLFACWSLLAWAFHGVSTWAVSHADGVGSVTEALATLQLPDGLKPWLPPEAAQLWTAMLTALAPAIDAVIGWMPSLDGPLSLLVWVVWALGAFALLLLGIGASGLIFYLRRGRPVKVPPRLRLSTSLWQR